MRYCELQSRDRDRIGRNSDEGKTYNAALALEFVFELIDLVEP